MSLNRFISVCLVLFSGWIAPAFARAQSVQPVIMEYKNKAEGKFAVTNNTLDPMVVVLEAKSFSIGEDGRGMFRALDPNIHVELSTMSLRLRPGQTYYVFYKASAEVFPAWFTIYSTFTSGRHGSDVDVRIQLPHTVYLYQNAPIEKDSIHVSSVVYSATTHKLICELENAGRALGRVQEVLTNGPHGESVSLAGFPLLPGMVRRVEVDWKEKDPPNSLKLVFEHFTLKPEIDRIEKLVQAVETAKVPKPVVVKPVESGPGH